MVWSINPNALPASLTDESGCDFPCLPGRQLVRRPFPGPNAAAAAVALPDLQRMGALRRQPRSQRAREAAQDAWPCSEAYSQILALLRSRLHPRGLSRVRRGLNALFPRSPAIWHANDAHTFVLRPARLAHKKARSQDRAWRQGVGGRVRGPAVAYQRMPSNGLKLVLPFTLSR